MRYSFPALLVFGFILASCTTTTKVTGLSTLPALPANASGVTLPFKLETSHPVYGVGGCSLVLSHGGEFKSYEVEFNPGQDTLFAELPSGVYGYKEFFCAGQHWDLTFKKWPRFQVFTGKISFATGMAIYLNDAGEMSVSLSGRSKSRDEALSFFGRIAPDARSKIVSAYTGKTIVPSAIESPAQWKNWDFKDTSGPVQAKDKLSWPSFRACYRGEEEVNGLWLGNLKIEVLYNNRLLSKIKVDETWNTFTDHFIACVKASLKEFRPNSGDNLHYTIYL